MVAALENQIIDDVVSTLEGIDGTGNYHVTLGAGAVVRAPSNYSMELPIPGIGVLHEGSRVVAERINARYWKLGLLLSLGMSYADDWDQSLRDFAGDCEAALLADFTRGGLAVNTNVQSYEVIDQGSSGLVSALVSVEIDYRVSFEDPTSIP